MAERYWIRRGRQTVGPAAREQLTRMAGAGALHKGDEASTDQVMWFPVESIPGLQIASPTTARRGGHPVRWAFLGAIVVALGVAAAVVIPLLRGGANKRVLQLAPPNAFGVFYVDVAALRQEYLPRLKDKEYAKKPPLDAILALAPKVNWAAVYVVGEGPRSSPIIMLQGELAIQDLQANRAALDLSQDAFTQKDKGRYEGPSPRDPRIIVGGEAPDLPAGTILIGRKDILTDEYVADLGKKDNEPLKKALAQVDTSAPVWGAMQAPEQAGWDGPRLIRGCLFPSGAKESKVTLEGSDDDMAKDIEAGVRRIADLEAFKGLVTVQRDGPTITATVQADKDLPDKIVAALDDAFGQARRIASTSNLHQIGRAIHSWIEAHRGELPLHLGELEAYIPAAALGKLLVSPVSKRPPPKIENGRIVGEIDYYYILDLDSFRASKPPQIILIRSPSEFVLAYERPENYAGRGTNVLFADGAVAFLPMADFQSRLAKTREEMQRWSP